MECYLPNDGMYFGAAQQAICTVLSIFVKKTSTECHHTSVIEAVVTVSKPLSLFTDALSGETEFPQSVLFLIIFLTNLHATSEDDRILVKGIKETIAGG